MSRFAAKPCKRGFEKSVEDQNYMDMLLPTHGGLI